jgi:hypothetical protein
MGFPANQMMPVGWITRATTSNPLWTTYKVEALECPMDSLWWAFDSMLVKGNGRDGRKLYLRFLTDNPRGNNNLGGGFNGYALGTTTQYDRDSVVAASPFLYPNEKVTLPVSGRLVQAVGIGGWLMGLSPRNQYVNDCQYKMAALFGFKQIALYRSENSNATVGEAFNTDVWNVYGSPTGAGSGSINHDALGFRQSSRVIWQHPGQFTLIPCRTGDYHVEVMVLGMLQPIRGLEKSLAGRPIQRCVPAWTINDPY